MNTKSILVLDTETKRKTPSGGVATATPPARTAHRMTTANRECGVTNLPQGKRRANLQQASRLANLGQGLRQPITVEGAVRHLAGVDTAVRIVEVNWCSAQAAKGGSGGARTTLSASTLNRTRTANPALRQQSEIKGEDNGYTRH